MAEPIHVLVVEDGEEYSRNLERFATEGYRFQRAGDGPAALAALASEPFDLIFLDMRFDRVQPGVLLGDLAETAERFNGDPVRARRFLEEHQGTYILAAVRAAGHTQPAIFSHDFDGEPRRWANLQRSYAPVQYLPDNAPAHAILQILRSSLPS
ncbi:MAG TPA: response regulator [Myxococcota bacterium]|nr:response regulator [Myxococcota bacterium]